MGDLELTNDVWDTFEIQRGLRQIPSLTARKAHEIATKKAELQQMEHAIKLVEAATVITQSSSKEKATATELKARAYVDSAAQRTQLIQIEKELAVLEADHEYLENCFAAIRKQANLTETEMRQWGAGRTQ